MKKRLFFITAAAVIFILLYLNEKPAEKIYIDNIQMPEQNVTDKKESIHSGSDKSDYILDVRAVYIIKGVVKSKKRYYFDDMAEISPYDFALAWGKLNSVTIDEKIRYTQSNRWYYYAYSAIRKAGVDRTYVIMHSANVHLIPANEEIMQKIKDVRENNYIRIKGKLVDIIKGNKTIKTSMTRNDSGKASCEIIYVEEIEIIK